VNKQGNRILIGCGEGLEEIIFLPGGWELLDMDVTVGGFLVFEQAEDDMEQNGQVFGCLVFADNL
jgi:hypothetical protein